MAWYEDKDAHVLAVPGGVVAIVAFNVMGAGKWDWRTGVKPAHFGASESLDLAKRSAEAHALVFATLQT